MTIVELLTSIANAIREKKKTTDKINAQNLAFEIKSIEPPLDTITLQQAGLYDVKEYKYAEVAPSELEAEYIGVLQGTATEVHIPEGTTRLRESAIYGSASNAEGKYGVTVHIPTSVINISLYPFQFGSMGASQTIKYAGTLSQWAENGLGFNCSLGYYLYINNELVSEITDITNFFCSPNGTNNGMLGSIIVDRIFIPNGSTVTNCGLAQVKAKEIIFEGTVSEEFGKSVFLYVKNATIKLPTNITTIPSECFKNVELDELTIPEGVTTIADNAFNYGTVKKLILPSTLTQIGKTYGVTGYNVKPTIVVNATTPPTATGTIFNSSYSPEVIYVPAGTLTAYQTATNWARYADYFVEMNEITLNVQAELLNNENYQYSTDGGQNWSLFETASITLEEVGLIKFKNALETTKLLIGKTAGAYDIGSITEAELTYATEGSMTIYLRLEEIT